MGKATRWIRLVQELTVRRMHAYTSRHDTYRQSRQALWRPSHIPGADSYVSARVCGVMRRRKHRKIQLAGHHRGRYRAGCGRCLDRRTFSDPRRSEEHTSELQSLMRISLAVFCLKKQKNNEKI